MGFGLMQECGVDAAKEHSPPNGFKRNKLPHDQMPQAQNQNQVSSTQYNSWDNIVTATKENRKKTLVNEQAERELLEHLWESMKWNEEKMVP